MKIAVLGGSFNPPHMGHLALAEGVRLELGYDLVLFVPAHMPPHKQLDLGASTEDRLHMTALAAANNPFFQVEPCEIQRGGISYTIDTVQYLEKKFASAPLEDKIGVIMGDDLISGFSKWKNASLLAEKTNLVLARRNSWDETEDFPFPHKNLRNTWLPLSSSEIRQRIKEKKAYRYLVPEAVYEYITSRKLYE